MEVVQDIQCGLSLATSLVGGSTKAAQSAITSCSDEFSQLRSLIPLGRVQKCSGIILLPDVNDACLRYYGDTTCCDYEPWFYQCLWTTDCSPIICAKFISCCCGDMGYITGVICDADNDDVCFRNQNGTWWSYCSLYDDCDENACGHLVYDAGHNMLNTSGIQYVNSDNYLNNYYYVTACLSRYQHNCPYTSCFTTYIDDDGTMRQLTYISNCCAGCLLVGQIYACKPFDSGYNGKVKVEIIATRGALECCSFPPQVGCSSILYLPLKRYAGITVVGRITSNYGYICAATDGNWTNTGRVCLSGTFTIL